MPHPPNRRRARTCRALACAAIAAAPWMAQAASEAGSNDTLDTAQSVLNAPGDFQIDGGRSFADPSDDFYAFTVRNAGRLQILASSTDGAADSILGLFGPGGALLASDDDGGDGSMSALGFDILVPGQYRLGLSGFNPGLLACAGSVTACYDTNGDFVFDTFVAGGGAGGSTGWDYRLSMSGVALVPEPAAALLFAPGLAVLAWLRRGRSRSAAAARAA